MRGSATSFRFSALALAMPLLLGATVFGCGSPAPQGGGVAELHEAARDGDLDRIRDHLARDEALLNEADENRQTALHHAVAAGHLAAAEFLLAEGADVASTDA